MALPPGTSVMQVRADERSTWGCQERSATLLVGLLHWC